MQSPAILYPIFALAAWTFIVLAIIPVKRFRAAFSRQVSARDFAYGESTKVPPSVGLPNRNYMNLLELPLLFYVVCLLLYVAAEVSSTMLGLAWVFVVLRVAHSLVHLTYNNVLHRMAVFSASTFVLIALWVLAYRALP